VVGNYTQGSGTAFAFFEFFLALKINAAKFSGALHQRHKQIRVVVRDDTLKNGGDSLQSHPGVNRRLGQRCQIARYIAIPLHEDKIPDFDVTATIAGEFAIRVAFLGSGGAHVVVNLTARTARARLPHSPEELFDSLISF
jgi:hypothetical protein